MFFVLPEVVVETKRITPPMGKHSRFKLTPQIKHSICAVPVVPNDAIRSYMPDIRYDRRRWKPSSSDPEPITGVDRNGVENSSHLVRKGETIKVLSKMYGVKEVHLLEINNGKYPEEGKSYDIFPEIDFKNNPYGGYQSPRSDMGVIYDSSTLAEIVTDFMIGGDGTCGVRLENMVLVGGAREQIKNWDVVIDLVDEGIAILGSRGFNPGDVFSKSNRIPSLLSYTKNSLIEHIKNDFGFANNAKDFFSPVHFIGSFGFSMRVNADGKTATAAVYDRKSVSSLLDNQFGDSVNKIEEGAFSTTHQRYV